jgi:hypothetical protein
MVRLASFQDGEADLLLDLEPMDAKRKEENLDVTTGVY